MAVEILQFVPNVKKVTSALVDIGLFVRLTNTVVKRIVIVVFALLVFNV